MSASFLPEPLDKSHLCVVRLKLKNIYSDEREVLFGPKCVRHALVAQLVAFISGARCAAAFKCKIYTLSQKEVQFSHYTVSR
jgi:hypothetical protein